MAVLVASVSDPYSLTLDPQKSQSRSGSRRTLNLDLDHTVAISSLYLKKKLIHNYKTFSSKEVNGKIDCCKSNKKVKLCYYLTFLNFF